MYKIARVTRLVNEIKEISDLLKQKKEELETLLTSDEHDERLKKQKFARAVSKGVKNAWANKTPEERAQWVENIRQSHRERQLAKPIA